jgi:hypothetical protein
MNANHYHQLVWAFLQAVFVEHIMWPKDFNKEPSNMASDIDSRRVLRCMSYPLNVISESLRLPSQVLDYLSAAIMVEFFVDSSYVYRWTNPRKSADMQTTINTQLRLMLESTRSIFEEPGRILLMVGMIYRDDNTRPRRPLQKLHTMLKKYTAHECDDILAQFPAVPASDGFLFYRQNILSLSVTLNNCGILAGLVVAFNLLRQLGITTLEMPALEHLFRLFRRQVFGGDHVPVHKFLSSWAGVLGNKSKIARRELNAGDIDSYNNAAPRIDSSFPLCQSYLDGENMVTDMQLRKSLIANTTAALRDYPGEHSKQRITTFLKSRDSCPANVLVEAANTTAIEQCNSADAPAKSGNLHIYTVCVNTMAAIFDELERAGARTHLQGWSPDGIDTTLDGLE